MVAGLTGGIGSGKSIVARMFELLGCAVFNSDQAAKAVYFNDAVKQNIISLLGREAYQNNILNKPYISSRIFGEEATLKSLNAIIHPAVGEMFAEFRKINAQKIIIKESALLFEAGLSDQVDRIIVVAAPVELRIARVLQRENITREEVLLRMKTQLPQEEKIKKAHFVVNNDGSGFVITQVTTIFDELKKN